MKDDQVKVQGEVKNFSALTLASTFYFPITPLLQYSNVPKVN
jgi:hypothetical protein